MRALFIVAAALCTASTSNAQAQWSEVSGLGTNIPVTRRESPGAADSSSMYVFGGQDGGGARLNDLWQFDGTAWTELTANGATGSPPARSRAAIAWDFSNNQLLVYGGHDGSNRLGDTWTWDSTNGWTQHSPANSPQVLQFAQAAYDGFNSNVLLFGGQNSAGADLNESWSWDGGNWTLLAPSTMPSPRRQHGMAARPDQLDIVMCCGQQGSTKLGDTYTWNGMDWSQVSTSVSPVPRVAMDMTYDQVRQRIVIPGGNNSSGNPIGNIAEFDGSDWTNLALDPVILKRTRYFLAFVPARGKSYMFGGQQVAQPLPTGTFQYSDPVPGTSYCWGDGSATSCPCGNAAGAGAGCMNTSGVGSTLSTGGSASVLVDDLVFQGEGLLPSQPALLFVGANAVNGGSGILFGDGLRCAGGSVVRLGVQVPDSGGSAGWGPGLGATGGWSAGDTRRFQLWYRDPSGSPCGSAFNLSNGVEIDFL